MGYKFWKPKSGNWIVIVVFRVSLSAGRARAVSVFSVIEFIYYFQFRWNITEISPFVRYICSFFLRLKVLISDTFNVSTYLLSSTIFLKILKNTISRALLIRKKKKVLEGILFAISFLLWWWLGSFVSVCIQFWFFSFDLIF